MPDFGRGIITPFQRDGKGDFANDTGNRLLQSDISELLGIIGPTNTDRGELPWRDEVGARFINLKHRAIDSLSIQGQAQSMSAGQIRRFETRVRVTGARVEVQETKLRIFVSYLPLGYNTNRTEEATIEVRRR